MSEDPHTPTEDRQTETETDADGEGSGLPGDVVEEAERLTRLAREVVDDAEAGAYRERRADLVDEYGYASRVRTEDRGETLVLYPQDWLDDEGTVRTERIEDTSRAEEVSLSGPGDPERWRDLDRRNRELVADVREEHGAVHGRNADAFADFMGNHYARPVESASATEVREFLDWYFPRNAWPTDEQRDVVESSLRIVFETAEKRVPEF
ncbi:DUF7108 family protein [Haloarchaeobius sp. HRN-SO-5]|uniref:DUF7108 family protein n=1 Tax=Haloarchaeobius sp. HRN-SO-5 TaxID=3446118 RepID=UPI003EC02B82